MKTTGGVGLFSLSVVPPRGSILLEMAADRTDNDVTNGIQDAITSLLVVDVSMVFRKARRPIHSARRWPNKTHRCDQQHHTALR